MARELREEQRDWQHAAKQVTRSNLLLGDVTRSRAMRQRHAKHTGVIPDPLNPLSRSLFCLLMAEECRDEIANPEAVRARRAASTGGEHG